MFEWSDSVRKYRKKNHTIARDKANTKRGSSTFSSWAIWIWTVKINGPTGSVPLQNIERALLLPIKIITPLF